MPDLENVTGAQIGIWLACAWVVVGLFNSASDAWEKLQGRKSSSMPDPIHVSEVARYATEADIQRVEKRVQHLEEAHTAVLTKMERDKSEIMESATKGRAHLNEQISLLAATCNRTAGQVDTMGNQIATLVQNAIRHTRKD